MRPSRPAIRRIVNVVTVCAVGVLLAGCTVVNEQPWLGEMNRKGWGWSSSDMAAAIDGPGYFMIRDADTGEVYFTRNGNFYVFTREDGRLDGRVWHAGHFVAVPHITLPADLEPSAHLKWDEGGTLYEVGKQDELPLRPLGSIPLALFWRPDRLEPVRREGSYFTVYRATPAAGPPRIGPPGTGGRGVIRAEFIEMYEAKHR